jgi:hypothetical protein
MYYHGDKEHGKMWSTWVKYKNSKHRLFVEIDRAILKEHTETTNEFEQLICWSSVGFNDQTGNWLEM